MKSNMGNFDLTSSEKWVVVSFGSGKTWAGALNRLKKQIEKSGLGLISEFYNENWLSESSYWHILSNLVSENPRGFGLWVWKPLIILDAIGKHPDAKGILYLDAGCELNFNDNSKKRFQEYIQLALERDILAFDIGELEFNYTDPLLIDYLLPDLMQHESQTCATAFFVSNSKSNITFLQTWYATMLGENFEYLKSTEERLSQIRKMRSTFVEHRHDQSSFSLLLKKANIKPIRDETYWHPDWLTLGKNYPIWQVRNRTRHSIMFLPHVRKLIRFILPNGTYALFKALKMRGKV